MGGLPFEPQGLQVVPLRAPELPEPPRQGEGGADCRGCTFADRPGDDEVWRDEHWRLSALRDSGVPLLLVLGPLEHHDLADLPHVARCHVSKWGDGGAHLQVFFYARPEGFPQLRGTCLAVWDDLLPAIPQDVADLDAETVAAALAASYGGRVVGRRSP